MGAGPPNAQEIERTCAIVRESSEVPDGARIVWAAVAEGAKGAEPAGRCAEVLAYDRPTGSSHRVDVDLDAGEVVGHAVRDDVQPSLIYEEYAIAGEIVKADPDWRAALARRGITDFDEVQIDPWPAGNFGLAREEGTAHRPRHLAMARHARRQRLRPTRSRACSPSSTWAQARCSRSIDHGVVPLPPDTGALLRPRTTGRCATTCEPLEITQPEGPSFTRRRQPRPLAEVALPGRVRPVRGLVLHRSVRRRRRACARSCTARRSARWSCPYGDPEPDARLEERVRRRRVGPRPHGQLAELGCDCLGEIHYFDAVLADEQGEP